MSRVKEPHYFSQDRADDSTAKYLDLFRGAVQGEAVGEASVGYLHNPSAPRRIKRAVPDARIIIIVRDPVERVYSHYFEFVRKHASNLTFEKAARAEEHTAASFYCAVILRYLDLFGPDRTKVIVFEEFVEDPRRTVVDVMEFLGVRGAAPDFNARAYNSYTASRAPIVGGILASNRYRRMWRALAPRFLRQTVRRRQVLYRPAEKPPMVDETRRFLQDTFR